ncbi:hypothetical protein [Bacteroides sp. 519]|uniref:NADase-type glycan-binding domain-containing protein n=1 Tax=Bacteroides sp. 519 TaxID=2302937 RepID=UPI0013D87367|nr:hypothetical protein [Bacteroides sp. 519]NDV57524.1 hypothetical protein [Bacteroides sp. 519]
MKHIVLYKCLLAWGTFFFLSGFAHSLYANGDPTTRLSAVSRSANPVPRTITDIHVIKEELRITPGIYTSVSVRYYLWNASDKDYKDIDYSFPVDYQGTGEVNSPLYSELYSESRYELGWHDDYIKEVNFQANGISLPFEISPETIIRKPAKPLVQDVQEIEEFGAWTEEEEAKVYASHCVGRKWYYTQFSIHAGETMILDVCYSVRNQAVIATYESIRRDWWWSAFNYDLSPAQHWGTGVVQELDVEIDISGVKLLHDDQDYHYQELYPNGPSPEKLTREGDKLVLRARNFDFSKAHPLYFKFQNPSFPQLDDWLPCRIANHRYTVTVSAENPSYPASNLTDMDLQTTWATTWNPTELPCVTIKFKEPVKLGAVLLLGGYHKNEKTFRENCRPDGIEALATVQIPESIDNKDYYYLVNIPQVSEYTVTTFDNLPEQALCLQRNIFNNSPVKEITITISQIIRGSKYDDLCISEIILLDDNIYLSNRIGNKKKYE